MRRDEKSEDKEEVSLPTSPPQSSVFQPSGTTALTAHHFTTSRVTIGTGLPDEFLTSS